MIWTRLTRESSAAAEIRSHDESSDVRGRSRRTRGFPSVKSSDSVPLDSARVYAISPRSQWNVVAARRRIIVTLILRDQGNRDPLRAVARSSRLAGRLGGTSGGRERRDYPRDEEKLQRASIDRRTAFAGLTSSRTQRERERESERASRSTSTSTCAFYVHDEIGRFGGIGRCGNRGRQVHPSPPPSRSM